MATVTDFQFEIDTTAYEEAEGKVPHRNRKLTWVIYPPAGIKHRQPFQFVDVSYGQAVKEMAELARSHVGPGTYRLTEWK